MLILSELSLTEQSVINYGGNLLPVGVAIYWNLISAHWLPVIECMRNRLHYSVGGD